MPADRCRGPPALVHDADATATFFAALRGARGAFVAFAGVFTAAVEAAFGALPAFAGALRAAAARGANRRCGDLWRRCEALSSVHRFRAAARPPP